MRRIRISQDKERSTLTYLIGAGMLFMAISNQNQPLKDVLLLSSLGQVLVIMSVLIWFKNRLELDFGPKALWIPLLVIALSIGVSGFVHVSDLGYAEAFAQACWGLMLMAVYAIARKQGRKIFIPIVYGMLFAVCGMVFYAFFHTGRLGSTGGWISPTNYDIATGLMIFGLLVSAVGKRWWLCIIAFTGVILTGAGEGVFLGLVLAVAVIARQDFSRRALVAAASLCAVLGIIAACGLFDDVFYKELDAVGIETNKTDIAYKGIDGELTTDTGLNGVMHGRIDVYKESLTHIQPFGHGYTISDFTGRTVHNVPLIIIDQVGIIAALAWLWVIVYCLLRTKWTYALIGVAAMCVFDHYMWTQVCCWWWALIGVASASAVESDLVFKDVNCSR